MIAQALIQNITMTKAKENFCGNIDQQFEIIFHLVDVPNLALFQVIQKLKENNIY
jgi:hypothetical protein